MLSGDIEPDPAAGGTEIEGAIRVAPSVGRWFGSDNGAFKSRRQSLERKVLHLAAPSGRGFELIVSEQARVLEPSLKGLVPLVLAGGTGTIHLAE